MKKFKPKNPNDKYDIMVCDAVNESIKKDKTIMKVLKMMQKGLKNDKKVSVEYSYSSKKKADFDEVFGK